MANKMLTNFVLQFCLWQNCGDKTPQAFYPNSKPINLHGCGFIGGCQALSPGIPAIL
jgi:hypothetical protein